jgi:FeS assembly SUF system protein
MPNDVLTFYDSVYTNVGGEDKVAQAGAPKPPAVPAAGREAVIEALKTIYDPEIPVNIYDLGLIYDIEIKDDGAATVTMTLTTPACPVAGAMPQGVADTVAAVEGIGEVEVQLVWSPPWSPDLMSDEARLALDMY